MVDDMEFVFRPEVQAIFDHFCALHGIRIAFHSAAGVELRVGRSSPNCAYCRMLRDEMGYEEECRRLDRVRREDACGLAQGLLSYKCHGGMTEAVMPVRVGGQLLGFVMIGQFRTRRHVPAEVLKKAPGRLFRRRLQRAFDRAPRFDPSAVRHVLGLFEVLVRFIADSHMIDSKDVLAPILRRMRDHPEERLALSQAAAMAGRSPTTLSHLFRREYGKSFRTMRIQFAMEKAEEYFRTVPGIRVNEVARRLGFDDPFYFTRLYTRYRGCSPRAALSRLRNGG